jgi:hypothetical protein
MLLEVIYPLEIFVHTVHQVCKYELNFSVNGYVAYILTCSIEGQFVLPSLRQVVFHTVMSPVAPGFSLWLVTLNKFPSL